jgi:hypothetical protein
MKSPPPLTLEAQERLRELYRKCSTGLLLLPEDFIAEDQLDPTRAPPKPAPRPHRARELINNALISPRARASRESAAKPTRAKSDGGVLD